MKIYNGQGIVLGRLGSKVAKDLLLGEEVKVVNCQEVIVSGKKTNTFANEKQKRKRKGYPLKSSKLSKLADKFVRRSIRGMLPWKFTRGKEAYRKLTCYVGIPEEMQGQELFKIENSNKEKIANGRYITVGEICIHLGGKE